MEIDNKKSWGLANGWPLVILSLAVVAGCGKGTNGFPADEARKGRPEPENLELWKEILDESIDSAFCLCSTTKATDYYFSHPDEFRQCSAAHFLNAKMDCATFKKLLEMEHLENLSISRLDCSEIPKEILRAGHLRYLSIYFLPGVDTVPSILFKVPNVEGLGIYGKTLAHFERDIPIAPKLGDLDFGTSPIKRLPMVFGKFPALSIITAGTPDRLVENDAGFRKAYPNLAFDTNDPE